MAPASSSANCSSAATAPAGPAWQPPAGHPSDPRFWVPVDSAYQQLLIDERARDAFPWLLLQTLATGVLRRALYTAVGALQPGKRVLDVGTGFAPVATEIAGAFGCRVVGLDTDRPQLARAAATIDHLGGAGWLRPSPGGPGGAATVSLAAGSAGELPFADGTFDAVFARFLLQHVPGPDDAVAEMARVAKPGGVICIVDVDDGLCVSYPEPPEPVRRLQEAYQRAQQGRGGDRNIGRRVAGMLDATGVAVDRVLALPQAAYGMTSPSDLGQRLLHSRLSAVAGELVERGFLDAGAVHEGLEVLATQAMPATTVVDVHLAVVGHRRH